MSTVEFGRLLDQVLTEIVFWDFIHGRTGVAPNGIELHPVFPITGV